MEELLKKIKDGQINYDPIMALRSIRYMDKLCRKYKRKGSPLELVYSIIHEVDNAKDAKEIFVDTFNVMLKKEIDKKDEVIANLTGLIDMAYEKQYEPKERKSYALEMLKALWEDCDKKLENDNPWLEEPGDEEDSFTLEELGKPYATTKMEAIQLIEYGCVDPDLYAKVDDYGIKHCEKHNRPYYLYNVLFAIMHEIDDAKTAEFMFAAKCGIYYEDAQDKEGLKTLINASFEKLRETYKEFPERSERLRYIRDFEQYMWDQEDQREEEEQEKA